MTKDRRQPLGGVDLETFVHSAMDPELNAKLTFNLISGFKSDICHEIKKIQCQPDECAKKFIKRFSEKIPLSMPSLLGIGAVTCFLVGYGALHWETVLKWVMRL